MTITGVIIAIAAALLDQSSTPSSSDAGLLTLKRLKVLATACEAQRLGDGRYPNETQLNDGLRLAVRTFARNLPYRDEWNTPFRISVSSDGRLLRIRSAGPDRKFAQKGCGDDYFAENGRILCPATASFAPDLADIKAVAQRITMIHMRAVAVTVEAYKMDHQRYPRSIRDFHKREPVYAGARFPERDAWGTPFRYVVSPDGQHYSLVSARADRTFDTRNDMPAQTRNDSGSDILLADGLFRSAPQNVEAQLDEHSWPE